jgi:hypothetical protein
VRVAVGCSVAVAEGRAVGRAVGTVVLCPQAETEVIIKITIMMIGNRFMLILPRKNAGSIAGNNLNRQTPIF